jgi:hypothetical protein
VDRWVIGGMATTLRVLPAVRVHVTAGFAGMPANKNLVKPKLPAAMSTTTWYLHDAFPCSRKQSPPGKHGGRSVAQPGLAAAFGSPVVDVPSLRVT